MQISRNFLGSVAAAAALCLLLTQTSVLAGAAVPSPTNADAQRPERIAAWQVVENVATSRPINFVRADRADLSPRAGEPGANASKPNWLVLVGALALKFSKFIGAALI